MREIKFRCFYRGQMLQVEQITFYNDGSISVEKAVHPEDDHIGIYPDSEHVKGVMQYTGLKDKNGKEIYKDDVVNVVTGGYDHWRGEKFIVYYDHAMFRIDNKKPYPHNINDDMVYKSFEVIGNIYENPELLK